MDEYYESLKRRNLIFTMHNIDPKQPYLAADPAKNYKILEMPDGPSYWSHKSGRYRDANEQEEYIASGCVDRELPPKK
jgi:hypothetical protein